MPGWPRAKQVIEFTWASASCCTPCRGIELAAEEGELFTGEQVEVGLAVA